MSVAETLDDAVPGLPLSRAEQFLRDHPVVAEPASPVVIVPAVGVVKKREPEHFDTISGALLFVAEKLDEYRAHPDFDGLDDFRFRLQAIERITPSLGVWRADAEALVDKVLANDTGGKKYGKPRKVTSQYDKLRNKLIASKLDATAYAVAYALFWYSPDAYPAAATLAEDTGLYVDTVRDALARLRNAKPPIIKRTKKGVGRGSDHYAFVL